jgi:Fis family transcriptional regulator, factor for inversion stimulation protein
MTKPFNKRHAGDLNEHTTLNGPENSLSECVEHALKDYFKQLDGHPAANLYDMLLTEVEAPLIKATLEHTKGNQSRTAEILGINRGTLRKKIKLYGL